MFLIVLYFLLFIYIFSRFYLLFEYLVVNRKMVADIEKEKMKNKSFGPFLPPQKYVTSWKKLYSKDKFLSDFFSLFLSIIPLIYFVYNSISGKNVQTILMYIIYPILIQLVNVLFERYGIDNTLLISYMYKERILAKFWKKKHKF